MNIRRRDVSPDRPTAPSRDGLLTPLAEHPAHLGPNSTTTMRNNDTLANHTLSSNALFSNQTRNDNTTPPAFNLTDVHNHTLLSDTPPIVTMTNRTLISLATSTTTEQTPSDIIMAGTLLGIFFFFFFCVVLADLRAKHRSGELRDDVRGIGRALRMMLLAVPMLLVAGVRKMVSLVSRKKTEVVAEDVEAQAEKTRASQVIVERLAAKEKPVVSLPETIVVSVTEVSPSASDEETAVS